MSAVNLRSAEPPSAAALLQKALLEMEETAWAAGVSPQEPLGLLFKAQSTVLTAFAGLAAEQRRTVEASFEAARKAQQTDLDQLRQARMEAEAMIRQIKATGTATEADVEKILSEVVKYISGEVAAGVRDTVVIKERIHNRGASWRQGVTGAALVAGFMMIGYAAHAWQSWDATAAVQRCRDHVLWSQAGQGFCSVDRVLLDASKQPVSASTEQPQKPSAR
ncbi:hypothetical protein [Roseomonas mucosa]|uniref:hypothetical protein n=1 Tax=Roseomonas mucosa TaxID=207340 RepID=UPI00333F7428